MRIFFCFLCLFASLKAEEQKPEDQLLVIFGSSGYIIYKVLDFASDHGFRFIKILSFSFKAFEHEIQGKYQGENQPQGRYFELKDANSSISFICLEGPSLDDPYIIDLEKYRHLIEQVYSASEEP